LWLQGCGGGGGGGIAAVATQATGAATIDSAGGTVIEASGASVVVPANAFTAATTVRLAKDSTGAPALPSGLTPSGDMYMLTPHGGSFAVPVQVSIPVPEVTLQPNQEFKLAKAQPGGEWEVLGSSNLVNGKLVAEVSSFSFFTGFLLTYPVALVQAEPFQITSQTLDCQGQDCTNLIGPVTATYTVRSNNGQFPSDCPNATLELVSRTPASGAVSVDTVALGGGSIARFQGDFFPVYTYGAQLRCPRQNAGTFYYRLAMAVARFAEPVDYPGIRVVSMIAQMEVVATQRANLEAVLKGAASVQMISSGTYTAPTPTNRAVIDWQRSDDNGASWRVVSRSYQDEANPTPLGSTQAWRFWSPRYGFIASDADNGALMRVYACYTPPDVPAPPCVTGPSTRINVLQQSALPAITSAPRSVLVRTGQTASFSATASGTPAPTLQWQSRPANSSGAWTNVSTGTGGTTGNYTTDVLALSDNGLQLRVVATNPVSSVESNPVTVSMSDVDVAPTISTQPGSLNVSTGNDAAFAIAARGTEALSYQWQYNGAAIAGANSPVLRLAAVTAGQAGDYRVVVSNAAGTVTSAAATLTVSAGAPSSVAPTIVTQPVTVVVNAGNTATLAVGVSGTGPFVYQWLHDGQVVSGATAAFYSIPSAAVGDSGGYSVQVSNLAGKVISSSATLQVNATMQATAPSFTTQPSPQVQAPGGSATFAVAASGTGPLSYFWKKDGAEIVGATSAVLVVNGINSADAGNYAVTVYNGSGSVTSNPASLTVLGAPAIDIQPVAMSEYVDATATFSVQANGSALGFQWMRNQIAITGATSASYTTPTLTLLDNGAVYAVVVYNGAGVAVSQGAVLTVMPLPTNGMTLYAGDFSGGGGGGASDSIGIDARFDAPEGLTSDSMGNIYVAQSNGRRVAKVGDLYDNATGTLTTGIVTTLLYHPIGTDRDNFGHVSLAPDGSLYTAGVSYCGLFRTVPPFSTSSVSTGYTLTGCPGTYTGGMAVNSSGEVFIAMTYANSIIKVGVPDGSGNATVSVFAGATDSFAAPGTADGTGTAARFNAPRGLAFGPNGDLFVADSGNHTIRRITPAGVVSTYAGRPGSKANFDSTRAQAMFNTPIAIAVDLYGGVPGDLYVLEAGDVSNNWTTNVRVVTTTNVVMTLFNAGDEAAAIAQPAQAQFARSIKGIAVAPNRKVYLTSGNAVVRRTF
jgi:hypothetical protein